MVKCSEYKVAYTWGVTENKEKLQVNSSRLKNPNNLNLQFFLQVDSC